MKPYFEDDAVTIYHGDCREVLPQIDPVDLVLTDPPYNAGVEYISHDDRMGDEAYAAWCSEWFHALDGKRTIIFPGHGNLPVWWAIRRPSAVGCWYKPGNPARGGVFQFCEWEPWLYWGPFLATSGVIRATVSEQADTGDHPCPKPLPLFRKLISQANPHTILDPFMGSGTTLRAAKDLGRKAIGIEIEERYCEIAAKRMAQGVLL